MGKCIIIQATLAVKETQCGLAEIKKELASSYNCKVRQR